MHFYITVICPVLQYCAPVCHYATTRSQAELLELIQKRVIHIVYPFTRGMSYSNILFAAELPPLNPGVTDRLLRSFFQDISHPSFSSLSFTSPPCDTSVLFRLRTATWCTHPISHTKRYCSFINYASLHRRFIVCVVYFF